MSGRVKAARNEVRSDVLSGAAIDPHAIKSAGVASREVSAAANDTYTAPYNAPTNKANGVSAGLPTVSEYIDALANPHGLFRTLGAVEPETDAWGNVRFIAGGNAVVFRVAADERQLMLKCYIRPPRHSREVYGWLATHPDPLLSPARLLTEELYVYDALGRGAYHDVVVAEWVDGTTLDTEIRRAAREYGPLRFRELSVAFDALASQLLRREWAHGDLKPENIVVEPDGRMRLVDYDAMFVPPLRGSATAELGTPPFQHPARNENHFDTHIDDYPVALISICLRALALDSGLFARHNTGDNLLFDPAEILAGRSAAYDSVLDLFARSGDHASYALAMALHSPTPEIPALADHFTTSYPQPVAVANTAADNRADYEARTPDALEERIPEPTAELFESGGLWGYMSPDGHPVVAAVCRQAYPFSEGLGVICIDGCWQAVDDSGRIAINCGDVEVLKPFSEGLAAFSQGGQWGYIDKEGNVAVEPRFEMAGSMREGRAVVRLAGKYGFADLNGNIAIAAVYDYATGFRNGAAMVILDGREMRIDRQGNPLGA